jgi:hypothetical protein
MTLRLFTSFSGAPQTARAAGAIVVRNGTRPPHTVTLAQVPGAGTPAAGDGFASALAVGVPGRDLHGARNADGITLIGGGDITDCGSRELSQGHGLAGRPHRNARVGTTLGIAQDRPGLDENEYDSLLVGIPAGGILTLRDGYPRLRGRLGQPRGTSGYGSVFTLAAPD